MTEVRLPSGKKVTVATACKVVINADVSEDDVSTEEYLYHPDKYVGLSEEADAVTPKLRKKIQVEFGIDPKDEGFIVVDPDDPGVEVQ